MNTGDVYLYDTISSSVTNVIQAHKAPLAIISFNSTGTLMATASDKGTVIRVFSVPNGKRSSNSDVDHIQPGSFRSPSTQYPACWRSALTLTLFTSSNLLPEAIKQRLAAAPPWHASLPTADPSPRVMCRRLELKMTIHRLPARLVEGIMEIASMVTVRLPPKTHKWEAMNRS